MSTQIQDPGRTRIGIAFCVGAFVLFASQDAITKVLVRDLSVPQILTIRFWGFAAFAMFWAAWRIGLRNAIATRRPALQIGRSALLIVEIAVMTLGFRYLALADMHAIFAMFPLIVTALAGPMLGEHVGWRRWAAVGIGCIGPLIILRPGTGVFQIAVLLPVGAAVLWALYNILTRLASRTDPFETSLFYTGIIAALLITPLGMHNWQPPTTGQWPLLLALVFVGTLSHLLLILALSYVEAATLQPFSYLLLVFATIMGAVFFDEFPDLWTVTGALIVVGSGLYVIWRERSLARRKVVERPLPRRPI
ncbi:MAG: DMT family transporter [Hyphomicrobiaceae bacterium]